MNLYKIYSNPESLLYYDNNAAIIATIEALDAIDGIKTDEFYNFVDPFTELLKSARNSIPVIEKAILELAVAGSSQYRPGVMIWWARFVKRGRWKEAEPFIKAKPRDWERYKKIMVTIGVSGARSL